jgi:hypothetical protein
MEVDDLRWGADVRRSLPDALASRPDALRSETHLPSLRGRARASLPDDLRSRTRSLRWRVGS